MGKGFGVVFSQEDSQGRSSQLPKHTASVRQKKNRWTCRKLPSRLLLPGVQHTGKVKRGRQRLGGHEKKQKRPRFGGTEEAQCKWYSCQYSMV